MVSTWKLRMCLLKMGSNNPYERAEAARRLGDFGDRRAVRPLIAALGHPHQEVRKNAAEALGKLGDPSAVESLLQMLQDNDGNVSEAAAVALGLLGDSRAVDPLCRQLDDGKNPSTRIASANALGELGNRKTIPFLIFFLTTFKEVGLRALEKIDPNWQASQEAKDSIPSLLSILSGGDRFRVSPKMEALRTVSTIDPTWVALEKAQAVVPPLFDLLKEAGLVRLDHELILETLGRIDPNWTRSNAAADLVSSVLLRLKKYESSGTSQFDNKIMKLLDRSITIPALVAALPNLGNRVRRSVEGVLNEIDPDWLHSELARAAVPQLVRFLEDRKGDFGKQITVHLLGQMRDRRATGALLKTLKTMPGSTTVNALGEIGDPSAIGGLVEVLVDPDLQEAAISALTKINADWENSSAARDAIPTFLAALEKDSMAAAKILGKVHARGAIEPLIRFHVRFACRQSDSDVATVSLTQIDPNWLTSEEAQMAVPWLVEALTNYDRQCRRAAADILDGIGWIAAKHQDRAARAIALENWWDRDVLLHPTALEALVSALTYTGGDEKVADLLAAMGEPALHGLLRELKHQDPRHRCAAAKGLGRIRPCGVVNVLADLLADDEKSVQSAAILGLTQLADPQAIDPLIRYVFTRKREYSLTTVERALLVFVRSSCLSPQIIRWIVGACRLEQKTAAEAVQNIIAEVSPVTTNLLHRIAAMPDGRVMEYNSIGEFFYEADLSRHGLRDAAAAELRRRGDPPYAPEAYLNPPEKQTGLLAGSQ